MKFSLHPELVPSHIDGFIIQSDFALSRFSALAQPVGSGAARAEHSRAELELNLAVRGRARYLIAEQRVSLEARQMLWILPQQNRLVIDVTPDFSAWVLVFRPRLVRRVCSAPASAPLREQAGKTVLLGRLPLPELQKLTLLYSGVPVDQGRDTFNAGLGYALARSWAEYLRSSAAAIPSEVHGAVQRAAWLLRDSKEPLDNTQLARRVGLSASRLSRLFKEQMGVPLAEFRNRQRLEHFLRLIDDRPSENLMDAALEAGFGSYAQFHRIFKQHIGSSPSNYLRKRKQLDPATVLTQLKTPSAR